MIITESTVRDALGMTTISSEEQSLLTLVRTSAMGAVKRYLQYDPVQSQLTEYYPQRGMSPLYGGGSWDINEAHTRGVWTPYSTVSDALQLRRIPVRNIAAVHCDQNGRFGKGAGAFGSGTQWTEGVEFWAEYEQANLCLSGILQAQSCWYSEPGSIRVQYRAGYAEAELAGEATVEARSGADYVSAGVDASPIRHAALIAAVQSFKAIWARRKDATLGHLAGPITGERKGDYSYTIGSSTSGLDLAVELPSEAIWLLEPFVHYGAMAL